MYSESTHTNLQCVEEAARTLWFQFSNPLNCHCQILNSTRNKRLLPRSYTATVYHYIESGKEASYINWNTKNPLNYYCLRVWGLFSRRLVRAAFIPSKHPAMELEMSMSNTTCISMNLVVMYSFSKDTNLRFNDMTKKLIPSYHYIRQGKYPHNSNYYSHTPLLSSLNLAK